DISWEGNGLELIKNFKKGDEVECKVLSIDVAKERIALGIKQIAENPGSGALDSYKKNQTVTCTVTEVRGDGVEVQLEEGLKSFIKKGDLSSEKSDQRPDLFSVGDRIDAKITYLDKAASKVTLSIRALELDEREKAIKEYGSTDSGASLGDILGA